jgi:hypothetical protein
MRITFPLTEEDTPVKGWRRGQPIPKEAGIPESWCCIDCGYNTAPGCSNRAKTEKAFETQRGIEQTYNSKSEVYSVHNHVWKAAGMERHDGCLCIGCLEKRLGRELSMEDFMLEDALNLLPGTRRLRDRRRRFKPKIEGPLDKIDWRSVCGRTA